MVGNCIPNIDLRIVNTFEEIHNQCPEYPHRGVIDAATTVSLTEIYRELNKIKEIPSTINILIEMEDILPYIGILTKVIHDKYYKDSNNIILIAARDAEVLYYTLKAYIKKHDGDESSSRLKMFVSSSALMGNLTYKAIDNDPIAEEFLKSLGITYETVQNMLANGTKIIVVDTGFRGSIGEKLRNLLSSIFNTIPKEEIDNLIETKLICCFETAYPNTSPIIDLFKEHGLNSEKLQSRRVELARAEQRLHYIQSVNNNLDYSNFIVATFLQLLVHFFDSINALNLTNNNEIVYTPESTNISHCFEPTGEKGFVNASFVHPQAAMLFSIIIVKYMLGNHDDVIKEIEELVAYIKEQDIIKEEKLIEEFKKRNAKLM